MKLVVENLCFGYSSDALTLQDVNIEIEEPGLYCIVGPNGVGKSTFIKCLNKLLKPKSGRVTIDGRDVQEMSLGELSDLIGYVPVKTDDLFSMPVIDSILIGRFDPKKWKTTKEDLDIVHRVMRLMGIEDLAMHGFNELSAGQHQKVAIARGIVHRPRMLILDEPTSNLDVKHQVYVTELLRAFAIQEDMIILMISHDLNISAKYAHKIIAMSPPGTICRYGDPKEVITEELINDIYGVEATVIEDHGRPHVILGSAFNGRDRGRRAFKTLCRGSGFPVSGPLQPPRPDVKRIPGLAV
jgi:iron complex transport system ATP-binding protein